jgi:hypothetical protein
MKALPKEGYLGYDDLINSMELTTLVEGMDHDYQGDSYYLFENDGQYGLLIFGWGSCSGCDALEAAYNDYDQIVALRDDLWNSIQWMTRTEMVQHINAKDFNGEFYMYTDEGKAFVKAIKEWAS